MIIFRSRSVIITCIGLLILQICSTDAKVDSALLCSSDYCKDYVGGGKCQDTPEDCNISNSTNSGINLPSPTFCNCCPYCVTNLYENDLCTQGSLGSPPSGDICGPELFCTPTGDDPVCKRMKSVCHDKQDDYDQRREDGQLGFLEQKPICNDEGYYGPVVCIPSQTCYCTNPKGERIFGEVINEKSIGQEMKCPCSIKIDKMNELIVENEFGGTRCLPDGSFDRIQCIDNRCFCVHQNTGALSSDIMIDMKVQSLESLPCYNQELQPDPTEYRKPCEKERYEMLQIVLQNKHDKFEPLGFPLVNCDADGNYFRIQINESRKVCVTPENKQIEGFAVEVSSPAAAQMNCNCARTLLMLKSTNGLQKLPTCCSNGNWRAIQCRKNDCYCVDQNGNQIGIEVDIEKVNELKQCYTTQWEKC